MHDNQPLIDAIERGDLDRDLFKIKQAIIARDKTIRFQPSSGFEMNDKVVISGAVRPQLLQGKTGRVTGFPERGKVSVELDEPVRRWKTPVCPTHVLCLAD